MNLTGKKILLIAPNFYGYQKAIQEDLERAGAIVFYFENKAFRNDVYTKGTYWFQRFFCGKNRYVNKKIVPATHEKFDVCLFVNLFSFRPELIQNLKKQNPDIKCFLYLWDNMKSYSWEQFFVYFNKVYTFDQLDARNLRINYLPNFYLDPGDANTIEGALDVSFVGSFQVHRFETLNKLAVKFSHQRKAFFFYLYLHPNYNRLKFNIYVYRVVSIFPFLFKGYKFLFGLMSGEITSELVHHRPLFFREIVQSILNSKCVLDIPFPTQTGCTQRLIQALALNRKVITTNAGAVHESFYDPAYIKVVPRDRVEIDWEWVNRKNENKLDMTFLRIDNWLSQILTI